MHDWRGWPSVLNHQQELEKTKVIPSLCAHVRTEILDELISFKGDPKQETQSTDISNLEDTIISKLQADTIKC